MNFTFSLFNIVYRPSIREFNKLVANDMAATSTADYDIVERLKIQRFKREDDD